VVKKEAMQIINYKELTTEIQCKRKKKKTIPVIMGANGTTSRSDVFLTMHQSVDLIQLPT
jgi:hypothetical protein